MQGILGNGDDDDERVLGGEGNGMTGIARIDIGCEGVERRGWRAMASVGRSLPLRCQLCASAKVECLTWSWTDDGSAIPEV